MANHYGKNFGFHTPDLSEMNANRIEKDSGIKFVDCSWHNDLCDSILNEEVDIRIMLPNSDNYNLDQEEFNDFVLILNDSTCTSDGMPMSYDELIKELIKYN